MNEELTKEERIARGARAAELLESEVFTEAMEGARERFTQEWLTAGTVDEREMAWAKVHGIEGIRAHLRRTRDDGEHAREALRRAQ